MRKETHHERHARLRALQGLLEKRRALIDPDTVPGLHRPQRQGRRAPGDGLSQAGVDHATGYAVGTYNRLINGRPKTPAFELLRAVATALRLTEQEWISVCRYARGEDPPSPLHERSGLEVPGMWKAVVEGQRHIAYITDQAYNVLCHNAAYLEVHPDGGPANMMRWMLLHPKAREVLADWATAWAPYVLPQLRAARAALPGDETLARIEADVLKDPEAGPLYEDRSTAQVHPDGNERPLNHPLYGPGTALICAAEPLASPNARFMVVQYQAGDQPQTRLPHLRAADTSGS